MSKLTPFQIYSNYKKGKIDKTSAINYLITIVESSNFPSIRIKSIEFLRNLNIKADNVFNFFKYIMLSDSDDSVRASAAEAIISNFKKKARESLKWVISHDNSLNFLISIYKSLENIKEASSIELMQRIEKKIGMNYLREYDISPKDAMGLKIIEGFLGHKLMSHEYFDGDHVDTFELESTHVIGFFIMQGYAINEINYLDLFDFLRKLIIKNAKLTRINNLEYLTNLRRLDLSGNELTEIKGLEVLTKLEELDLHSNYLTEIQSLENLINLRRLDLSDNDILKINGLENLVKLEELDLHNNRLTEIHNLENLINLSRIDLNGNELKNTTYLKTK